MFLEDALQKDQLTDRQTDGWMDRQTDGWAERQMDEWTDIQTDGQKDGQVYRQTVQTVFIVPLVLGNVVSVLK